MKENRTKKSITIVALSAVIVLFAALILVSTDHMNKPVQEHLVAEETIENNTGENDTSENIELYIPKLQVATIKESEQEAGTELAETVEAAIGEESGESLEIEAEQLQDIANTIIEQKKPQEKELATTDHGKTVVLSKQSEGKPRTATEAVPPETPPISTETSVQEVNSHNDTNKKPESTPVPAKPIENKPQSGDKNDNGEIYLPGFGWVPDEGGGIVVEIADFELSGELIGDM